MADTIFNPDGSVYMTFPPAVPSSGDLQGWHYTQVTATRVGSGPSRVVVTDDCTSLNGLLRVLSLHNACRSTVRGAVAGGYRWAWEEVTASGRVSNVVFARKVEPDPVHRPGCRCGCWA